MSRSAVGYEYYVQSSKLAVYRTPAQKPQQPERLRWVASPSKDYTVVAMIPRNPFRCLPCFEDIARLNPLGP